MMMHCCRGWYALCLVALMNIHLCWAVQHVVGDDRGWDPLSNIKKWSSHKIFRVGDNLWFAYASAQQSVVELNTKEEYERCDMSNPIKVYTGGLDAVPLVEVGTSYFTSGRLEDCQRGMKLHVNVISDGIDQNSDNYDVVSDGLEYATNNLDLISDGMESGAEDRPLISDGLEKEYTNDHSSSSSSFFAASADMKMAKMQAAEGPTSGILESSYSLRSFSLSLVVPFCCLVTTMLYAMA